MFSYLFRPVLYCAKCKLSGFKTPRCPRCGRFV